MNMLIKVKRMGKGLNHIWVSAYFIFVALCVGMLFLNCTSCNSRKPDDKEKVTEILTQWIGKQLNLPSETGRFTTNGDSADAFFPTEKYNILKYIGPEGCTACDMHLNQYPSILSELSRRANVPVGFVCIICPTDLREVRRVLWRDNKGRLAVWIDEADTLNSINSFPENEDLQTFLLDQDNRVLAIGDPATNPKIMRLYSEILSKDTTRTAELPLTELKAETDELKLGNVSAADTIRRSIKIKNTGDNCFYLDQVTTSCDCVTATLSTKCIEPGETATLSISFTESNKIGDFYRTVNIYGNTAEELSIEITGCVK